MLEGVIFTSRDREPQSGQRAVEISTDIMQESLRREMKKLVDALCSLLPDEHTHTDTYFIEAIASSERCYFPVRVLPLARMSWTIVISKHLLCPQAADFLSQPFFKQANQPIILVRSSTPATGAWCYSLFMTVCITLVIDHRKRNIRRGSHN